MNVFADYARYYNLLYRDKDYQGEAQFVHQQHQRYSPQTSSLLELGSGTGRHAECLAGQGYTIHGIDISADMLQRAEARRETLDEPLQSRLTFSHGDVRHVRLSQQFDAAISLFHVISYQTSHDDLAKAFTTARQHLKPGGLFLFDFWYGPAVLSGGLAVRIKRLEDEYIQLLRIAEPQLHPNDNIVDVNYTVFMTDKETQFIREIQETHRMRYLFQPELEQYLRRAGFSIAHFGEWMTGNPARRDSWGAYIVAAAT